MARSRPQASGSNGAAAKEKPTYVIYTEGEAGRLDPLGEFRGRNASEAAKAYFNQIGDMDGELTVIAVPTRNITKVTAKVETVKKVAFT